MFRPNLRQTIVIGIVFFTSAFGGIALLALTNINRLQQETLLVERADDLRNLILEIRREEKNFFLYHDPALFSIGRENLERATAAMDVLSDEMAASNGREHGAALLRGIKTYADVLEQLKAAGDKGGEYSPAAKALRETGQNLVEHSRAVAELERENIFAINQRLRLTLIISVCVVAMVITALVVFVSKSILGPLRRVHEATRSIARGTFVPLTVRNADDEIQQVFVALNAMVEELKKRQNQLVQAQKLSSVGTLASGIAHQLNNPLNNIFTSAQILAEKTRGDDAFADKMMDNIAQETLRARDIVRGLLEFSRHKDFSPSPCDLKSVLNGAVRLVSSQIGPRITLEVSVPEGIVLLLDRRRFQEALINLVINAVQAIEDGEGRIEIGTRREDAFQVIFISDTGGGMPPDTLQQIFDPFFSTKDVGRGTGLGLYVVYGIIEEHNGSIRAESALGEGTTFFIALPLGGEGAAA